jgi:hypothetical protein
MTRYESQPSDCTEYTPIERELVDALNDLADTPSAPHFDADAIQRRTRRKRATRLGAFLSVGLAAAVAATVLTGPGTTTTQAGPGPTNASTSNRLDRISAVAYTLQRQGQAVKLTIETPSGKLDAENMRRDLKRMNVKARVYLGDPNCTPKPRPNKYWGSDLESIFRTGRENGKQVLYVNPNKIPADSTLAISFPLAKIDPAKALSIWAVGLRSGEGPSCLPAPKDKNGNFTFTP